ncbi:MAG: hypothetical protein ISS64_04120 [Desulfobacterales bacterium]|nr:hypothetical protein [Desulfobacterales bacterium]
MCRLYLGVRGRGSGEQGTAECRSASILHNSTFFVRPARNAFGRIFCSAYNIDVSAAIIILTLITLHGRRVFDIQVED